MDKRSVSTPLDLCTALIAFALGVGCGDSDDSTDTSADTGTDTGSSTTASTSTSTTTTSSTSDTSTSTLTTSDTTTESTTMADTGSTTATTGSTGTGTTDGTSGVCEAMAACGDCFACAQQDPTYCADEKAACAGDADCTDVADCVDQCPPVGDPDFEQCHDDCADGAAGEDLFKALGACLACEICSCGAGNHPEC